MQAPPKALELPLAPAAGSDGAADPELARRQLLKAAREGLPVKGYAATWEAARPKVLGAEDKADKVGGQPGWQPGWPVAEMRSAG